MSGEIAGAAEDDLVTVGEEGAGFSGGKGDWLGPVAGELEKASSSGFGRAGDSSCGEDVSDLKVAAVAGVMGYQLGRAPVEILGVALA